MWRQGMWRQNAASAGNAASGENVASGNAASQGFWNAASECEFSVRWKSTVPFAAALQ